VRIPGAGRRRFATPSYNQNFNLKLFLLIIVHAVKRMTLQLPGDHRRRERRANKPTCVCERSSSFQPPHRLRFGVSAARSLRDPAKSGPIRDSRILSERERGILSSASFDNRSTAGRVPVQRIHRSLASAFPTVYISPPTLVCVSCSRSRAHARTHVRAASVANLTIERSILGHCTRGLE